MVWHWLICFSFRLSSVVRSDHGCFLCRQMLDFLHCPLLRITNRDGLSEEDNLDALMEFDFMNAQVLSVSQLVEKIGFCAKAMRASKGWISVETEKHKKTRTDVFAGAVKGEMYHPHVDQGRANIRYVFEELINHPTIKSALVLGLARFDYVVLLTLPRDQSSRCYSRLLHRFCVRGWLVKELKIIHSDDCMELGDLRFVLWMSCALVRRCKTWSPTCHPVRSWPNESIRHTNSSCVVCAWGMWCLNCLLLFCLVLVRRLLKLICQTLLCLCKAIWWVAAQNRTLLQVRSQFMCSVIGPVRSFGDKAVQPCYDSWPSVDFHD